MLVGNVGARLTDKDVGRVLSVGSGVMNNRHVEFMEVKRRAGDLCDLLQIKLATPIDQTHGLLLADHLAHTGVAQPELNEGD